MRGLPLNDVAILIISTAKVAREYIHPDEGDPDSGEDDPDTDEDDPGTDEAGPSFVGNGIKVNSKGGEIDVLLKGSMTAEEGTGIIAQNSDPDGGQAEVIVEGDISAKNGVSVLNQSSSIDVSISGNVEAGDGLLRAADHRQKPLRNPRLR